MNADQAKRLSDAFDDWNDSIEGGRKQRCAEASGSAPKLRYRLPPEMSDGQHWAVVDDHEAVIESVKAWLAEATEGEEITIKTCMMTDEEVDALPPI